METWDKSGLLEAYADSLNTQDELDRGLQNKKGKQEWLDAFERRAVRMEQLFTQNQAMAQAAQDTLREPMTPAAAEFLYERLLKVSSHRRDDGHISMPILILLIPYYEEKQDAEKLVRLYGLMYNLLSSIGIQLQEDAPTAKTEYSRAILALRDKYASIRDPRARQEFFMAYSMICVSERSEGLVSADESYRYLREMLELWNSKPVQKLDGENEHINWYITLTQRDWLEVEEEIDGAGAEVREYFCQLSEEFYRQELEEMEEEYLCSRTLVAAHYHAQILRGILTWDGALRSYFDYYTQHMAHLGEAELNWAGQGADEADFLLRAPLVLERWLHHCADPALRNMVLTRLKEDTHHVISREFAGTQSADVATDLSKWCFTMLPYLKDRAEKEEWILNLVVCKQFPTYLHSVMVQRLAAAILEVLLREQPDFFAGLAPLVEGQTIPEFLSMAALLHDMGKNEIGNIINTQLRTLEDAEFAAIRKHPSYGYALIGDDPDLARYKDVVIGHHKFYNGQGGYPADFDNTASPFRAAIDLITVCDCLDAATDNLGRSYKKEKSFEEVLEEFRQDRGVRYAPAIIDCIDGSPALREKLRFLVSDERSNIAYEIYTALS